MLSDIQGAVFSSLHNIYTKKTYNSKMRTISSSSSKASWRLMSLQWWRWFMMSISLRIKAFSMACPMGMNLAAYTCWVFSSLQRWTWKEVITKIPKKTSSNLLLLRTVPEFLFQDQVFSHLSSHDIFMLSNHRVLKSLHFSYSYQSVFCKERCVYFESTTFTVSSSFYSMHQCPPTKGGRHPTL